MNINTRKKSLHTAMLSTAIISLSSIALSGCGQKGDLYMPESQPTIEQESNKDSFLLPEIQKRIDNIQNDSNDF